MRWRSKFPPSNPKPGEKHLFVKRPKFTIKFLDCGCIIFKRPYLEAHAFGRTALEEFRAGFEVRPHAWRTNTICFNCFQEHIDEANNKNIKTIEDMIQAERDSDNTFVYDEG